MEIDTKILLNWFLKYRHILSGILFITWVVFMIYWFYCFYLLEAKPNINLCMHINEEESADGINARAAIAFIFWFSTTGVILIFLIGYVLKFAYNIALGLIEGIFPKDWHYFISSITFILLLYPSFNYMYEIKSASLSLYDDGKKIVHMALGAKPSLKIMKKQEIFE
ncbi:MAG: hypothetical protein L3V56_02395 [Candidatus Magnetoovum sp. WYHC-5]|nr:hypothetical protein [Candidatus Magnetoovum sp. WYHC-5]